MADPTVVQVHHGSAWSTKSGAEVSALLDRLKLQIAATADAYGDIRGVIQVAGSVSDVAELLDDGPESMARRMVADCAARGQTEVCALAIGAAVAWRLRSRTPEAIRCAEKLDAYLAAEDGLVTILVVMAARYALVRLLPQLLTLDGAPAPGGVS